MASSRGRDSKFVFENTDDALSAPPGIFLRVDRSRIRSKTPVRQQSEPLDCTSSSLRNYAESTPSQRSANQRVRNSHSPSSRRSVDRFNMNNFRRSPFQTPNKRGAQDLPGQEFETPGKIAKTSHSSNVKSSEQVEVIDLVTSDEEEDEAPEDDDDDEEYICEDDSDIEIIASKSAADKRKNRRRLERQKSSSYELESSDADLSEDEEEGYVPGIHLDDNTSEGYFSRIATVLAEDVKPDLVITRKVSSKEFGESDNPWKVDRCTWERLHDFQKEGVQWLQKKTDHRSGGILADQMGLGKTMQAVVYLRSIAETGRNHYKVNGLDKALIVCNVSVISQWIKAMNEWFPLCRVFLIHSHSSTGKNTDFVTKIFEKLREKAKEFPHGAVILTTYGIFTKYHAAITKEIWQVAILDEGHYIRNEKTQCSLAMKKLITTQRFILTGTPFQNRLSEFWKLVDFVHPGRLSDSTTFHRNFTQIINAGSNLNCHPTAAAKAYECLVALHRAVKPLIKRRLQEEYKDVLQLPEKDERVFSCELSRRQRRLYEEYLRTPEVARILEGNLMSFCGIQKLSDICNHPGIFRKARPGSSKFGAIKDSGKCEMVFKLLDQWLIDSSNRVIIFTQRRNVVEMLKYFLEERGIPSVSFTGNDTAAARPKIIKKFEKDESIRVFVMTTRAGGLGLNLTCANKMIIYDPDWNPAADNQAKDRIYRMGQRENVTIVRLISNGTLEDKKYLKQVQKEVMGQKLLHNSDASYSIPNNTLADLFQLKPKGLEGSEIGVYIPGEIAGPSKKSHRKEHSESNEVDDENWKKVEKKAAKKKMKNKLAGFEDHSLLLTLFDDQKLVAMRQHSINVQNDSGMNRVERQAMRKAVDDAVGSLLHTEGRLAHTWKQEFHRLIIQDSSAPLTLDYVVEKESLDTFWDTVHNGTRINDDERELKRLVLLAQNIATFLNGVPGATEETIHNIFIKDYDRSSPTQMFFIQEIISTLARYDDGDNFWKIRAKYRNVQFKEPKTVLRKKSSSRK